MEDTHNVRPFRRVSPVWMGSFGFLEFCCNNENQSGVKSLQFGKWRYTSPDFVFPALPVVMEHRFNFQLNLKKYHIFNNQSLHTNCNHTKHAHVYFAPDTSKLSPFKKKSSQVIVDSKADLLSAEPEKKKLYKQIFHSLSCSGKEHAHFALEISNLSLSYFTFSTNESNSQ